MSLHKPIRSGFSGVVSSESLGARVCGRIFAAAILAGALLSAAAKDATPIAIILYDGPRGPDYVQIAGITLNGKTELRVCDGVPKIDKRAYDNLPRMQLSSGSTLTRGADGVLTLTVENKPVCVVPSNVRFDKNAELTPAEAAEQAVLQGTPIAPAVADAPLPAFKPGVRVVFVTTPDAEFADYLIAQRANSVNGWQQFLARYPASARALAVKSAITDLDEHDAEAAFAQYQKSASAHQPDLEQLKRAYSGAQAAAQAVPGYRPAFDLIQKIAQEIDGLLDQDRVDLRAFRKALQDRSSGYSHLVAARKHIDQVFGIRADYAPTINLRREIVNEDQKLDAAATNAEALLMAKHYDEAMTSLGPYIGLAPEVPRVHAVLNADFEYHLNQGRELAGHQSWEQAAAELRQALAIRGNSQEASAALTNAIAQLNAARNQQTASLAVVQSDDFASKGDYIEAYNTLAELPEAQRALVATQIAALTKNYLSAATRRAQKLQEGHLPIRTRADEDATREACDLLDHAGRLSGDPAIKLKHDFLAGKISAYYIDQAKRRLDKPLGSGVGIGWLYLREAQRYDADLGLAKDQLKDLTAVYAPVYQRRSRLSVGIVIRDQTSRRDSVGFADQIADAIANGLDPAGVVLVRHAADATDVTQPNFVIVGEILDHRVTKNAALETLSSKYRAGTHEVKNPEWLQVSADYDAAQQQLAAAQHSLADDQAQRKKKEVIAAATDAVQQAQQHADDLRHKLETANQSRVDVIVEPYQYTRKTVDLTASIDLAFRMNDRAGNTIEPAMTVHKDNHKTAVVLENVKPEDTEGVSNKTVEPDEAQFLTDLEIVARDALVEAVREEATKLPAKILEEARARVQRGDLDGAGEEYVLYLNATPDKPSAERDEAAKFLHDQYDLAPPATDKS